MNARLARGAGAMLVAAALALPLAVGQAAGAAGDPRPAPPEGTEVLGFENLEGVMLVTATLRSSANSDTTVLLVVDTGAGYLALDRKLAVAIGLSDSASARTGADADAGGIGLARRALPRLRIETLEIDHVWPVLVFDAKVVREVTDRPIEGLIGQSLFVGRALQVDYRTGTLAIIPVPPADGDDPETRDPARPGAEAGDSTAARSNAAIARSRAALAGVLSDDAVPIVFDLAGDGKILVRARVSDAQPPRFSRWLTLVLDTGATKTVLFAGALEQHAPRAHRWRSLNGLAAPTLFGTSQARIVMVPVLEIASGQTSVSRVDVDAAVMTSDLSEVLSQVVEEPVHGLLGYSFLKHYRLTIDYPNQVVWLEPQPGDWTDRPYEYSHVGVQLARVKGALRVLAVVDGSPAARAGIRTGDVLRSVDGRAVADMDVAEASRSLEGPPGTTVTIEMQRGDAARRYRLVRRWLM